MARSSPSLPCGGASPRIVIPDPWSEAADAIAYGPSPRSAPPVTVVCGPKNSGKSTFSRFLVNTLLHKHKNIAYLDTDVGQPEFTPSGFISLHILSEQLSDLGSTSLKTPIRCLYYGDISSKRDPKYYTTCILHLYDYFVKEFYQYDNLENVGKTMWPLVINTPGWVKGIGFELLVEMLKYVGPSHVIQIRISAESKNLPSGAFWSGTVQDTNVIEIYAARKDCFNRTILVRKNARELRDARIMVYFQQCIPPDMNVLTRKGLARALASVTPYEVLFSGIKVIHLHCQVLGVPTALSILKLYCRYPVDKVPRSEIFHSLNATTIGLAISSGELTKTEVRASWCVGLGIVRSIDVSKDLLYIITPVPLSTLEKVDLLLQGFIEIPISLLQVHGCTSPYLSRNVLNRFDLNNMLDKR